MEQQQISRLVSFGERRCYKFLAPKAYHPPPVFGLTDFAVLLGSFENDSAGMISLLRNWAMRELDSRIVSVAVIRYRESEHSVTKFTNIGGHVDCTSKHGESETSRRKRRKTSEQVTATSTVVHWMYDPDDDQSHVNQGREVLMPPGPGLKPERYIILCGDPKLAVICIPSQRAQKLVENNCMSTSQLIRCIEQGDIKDAHVKRAFHKVCEDLSYRIYFDSLDAIEAAREIYSQLRGAKVDLQVTSSMVSNSKWWRQYQSPFSRTRQALFSCIAYFETGIFNVDPNMIGDQTFAVCHSTSIFVASDLLRDPIDSGSELAVDRVVGNIGKPGLAFLIAPPKPKIRKLDYSAWNMVVHEPFDGKAENNFQGTSFHLSFTGYELPLDLDRSGGRDAPAYLLETAVSVYDQAEWVADVDILASLGRWDEVRDGHCGHRHNNNNNKPQPPWPVVSVDTWLELLDPPVQKGVVRAYNNPMARLATATLAARLSHQVVILEKEPCWTCVDIKMEEKLSDIPAFNKSRLFDSDAESDGIAEFDGGDAESERGTDGCSDDDMDEVYAFNLPAPDLPSEKEDELKSRILFIY